MKKGFVFNLLAVLALAGCQTKELDYALQQESKHFTATIEDDFNSGETRTFMDENGNVRWKQGDQVSIFAGSTVNEQYQVTDASDGKTSAGFNKLSGGGFVGGGEIDNNVAFYPYTSTAEIAKSGSAYVISDITLPATQNYAEASFGNGAFPMAAVTSNTDDMHLKFKNVLGGLKLQLKGTASIASISVTGNRDEVLCGAAAVTVSNGSAPSINLTDATAKTVTLDCGDGVQLNAETATAFVIALPPMTMEGGFTVVVTDTEGGTMEIKTTKSQTINRSSLLKMPAVVYEGTVVESHEYVNLGLSSGLLWATTNIGALSPEMFGDYFAWGETTPYYEAGFAQEDPQTHWKEGKEEGYNYPSYSLCEGTRYTLTKYVDYVNGYGERDGLHTLESSDDAAYVNWGTEWRIPTLEDWSELYGECYWEWTDSYNSSSIKGYIVYKSKTLSDKGAHNYGAQPPQETYALSDTHIFLPQADYWNWAGIHHNSAYYWSSTLMAWSEPYKAYCLYFQFGAGSLDYSAHLERVYGLPIRPVRVSE